MKENSIKQKTDLKHKNAVLQGLENIRGYDGHGDGIQYTQNGIDYTLDQMISEVEKETEVGNKFMQNVYDNIILYMGKFSQDAE